MLEAVASPKRPFRSVPQEVLRLLWDIRGTPLGYILDMAILILTLGAMTLGFAGEAAMLLTLIALLITKELFDARPLAAQANPSGRAFYLGTLPLALIFAAIVVTRVALP